VGKHITSSAMRNEHLFQEHLIRKPLVQTNSHMLTVLGQAGTRKDTPRKSGFGKVRVATGSAG
jgi:hypothetical protein